MPLKLDVVTIEREVYSADDVDMVLVPSIDGLMGILPRHSPVVTALRAGSLEIVRGDIREVLAVGGGFAEVVADRVIVMADVAEQADEIDIARAEAARERAKEALSGAPEMVDRMQALADLRRAEVRLRVARRKRTRGSARVASGSGDQ